MHSVMFKSGDLAKTIVANHELAHKLAEAHSQLGKAVMHCIHHESTIANAIHCLEKGKVDTALHLLTVELDCYRLDEDQ